jgi:hypothetical protein
VADAGDAVAIECPQIGVHGVDVDTECTAYVDGRHPIGIPEQRFGTAFLPRPEILFLDGGQESPHLSRPGLAGLQRSSHRCTSSWIWSSNSTNNL